MGFAEVITVSPLVRLPKSGIPKTSESNRMTWADSSRRRIQGRQEEELSDDSDAYDLSAFPELLKACHEWTYTLEDLKKLGLVKEKDKKS
jgi:hypothetical protein